jgi:hypothetical protein
VPISDSVSMSYTYRSSVVGCNRTLFGRSKRIQKGRSFVARERCKRQSENEGAVYGTASVLCVMYAFIMLIASGDNNRQLA